MSITSITWWIPLSLISLFAVHTAMASSNLSTDASALLSFKSRLLDDSSLNWFDNSTSLVCNWTGITCGSRHRRVTGLDLSGMGLSARFPQEVSRLRRLRFMDLRANELIGEIPQSIGLLTELRILRLSNNSFTGSLPNSLANATKLERLSIQFNNLEGTIPALIFNLSNLIFLTLDGNRFSGTLPSNICSSNISACSRLQFLALNQNQLSGSIPSDLSSRSSQLREVYVYGNRLTGELPENIGEWEALEVLNVRGNNITGRIPIGLRNLTSLWALDLSRNMFTGLIPNEVGLLPNLEFLSLGDNTFMGEIPAGIFNISTLGRFSVSRNNLTGKLPLNFCNGIPNLVAIYLNENQFFGEIPQSVSNCTNLRLLEIAANSFSGVIPNSISELRSLQRLSMGLNSFVCESPECSFITALTNCRYLNTIVLSDNSFNASIPKTVGNFSSSMSYFACSNCRLDGILPVEFGNLTELSLLNLADNRLIGSILTTIGRLMNLQRLALSSNFISGFIPDTLCSMQSCGVIYLDVNQITGNIPSCIGNLTTMRILWISNNRLESFLPRSLWQLGNVLELNLSRNLLTGELPSDIGNLNVAYLFDLSENRLSGAIPGSIQRMNSLTDLSLAYNEFEGSIPESIATILSLEQVNLSHNRLSGIIPSGLQAISSLVYFDVSFNNLTGPIPSEGPFRNFSYVYFQSNEGLCGESRFGVPLCNVSNPRQRRRNELILIICLSLGTFIIFICVIMVFKHCWRVRNTDAKQDEQPELSGIIPIRISYYDIVRATENFSNDHLLGTGAFGSVYKGVLQNGSIVAVKVFNLQLEVASRSFDVECEVFRTLRHRNLCKVISACSNEDFKAIIMEYMPNGSIEKWLYTETKFLNISQRLSIMIDIASSLEYLHQNSILPVVHCDVKPSNILLDADMVAHLSDFGISKLLRNMESFVQTATFPTLGYIAPEYGSKGLVSTRCDVYSFGIVLMEVFTGKSPSNDEFVSDLTLRNMVRNSISDGISEIVDRRLLNPNEAKFTKKLECLSCVFELALKCSMDNPNERVDIKEVVGTLKNIHSML